MIRVVGETGRTSNILLNEYRKAYKKGDLNSKLVIHSLETDHKPDSYNLQILALNRTNCNSRIFLERWFTRLKNYFQKISMQRKQKQIFEKHLTKSSKKGCSDAL